MHQRRIPLPLLLLSLSLANAVAQNMVPSAPYQPTLGHLEATKANGSLIGIQYEHWFFGPQSWTTAEAIPFQGKYTTDEKTVSKHFAEFRDLGVDWLLIDWTNMLWMKPAWEQHVDGTRQLEEKTDVLFKTALDLHRQGRYAPKLVFMLGLQNGPPVADGVQRLNGILEWIEKRYLDRPEYKDLWLYDHGKPLLTILYWPPDPCTQLKRDLATSPVRTQAWTVRWMASQLQDNHAERCGMWSWMDGTIPQVLTKREGQPEEVVVTPASFRLPGKGTGWTGTSAIGRDHGVPYLESWRIAFENHPKFIQIHQWNEFAGQKTGQGIPLDYWGEHPASPKPAGSEVYGDEYDLNLSDDIEPTQLHTCTLRGCGGWGYYYVNLTKAIISLYRGETPDITILALSGPPETQTVKSKFLALRWEDLGKPPSGYSLFLDGKLIVSSIEGKQYNLDLSRVSPGLHRVKLAATAAHTYFDLNAERLATRSVAALPVESEITFKYVRP